MRQSLIDLVQQHNPFDATEAKHVQTVLLFLQEHAICTSRSNLAGHVTASAWVLCPQRKHALLTHHRKLNRWLQLGGHIENDATIQQAALREAKEESGIEKLDLLSEAIFDIDVHQIPANKHVPEHFHYDLRFLFQAQTAQLHISEESNDLQWIELDQIGNLVSDVSIARMVSKSGL